MSGLQFGKPLETAAEDTGQEPLTPEAEVDQNIAAQRELAHQDAGRHGHEIVDRKIYSSHPIQKFAVGRFQFVDSVLKLNARDAADFDALLASMPHVDRSVVKVLDLDRANAIAASHRTMATKDFDSSAGRAALAALQAESPMVGTKKVDTTDALHAPEA